jgi:sugar phosphate isomerase/epimerase
MDRISISTYSLEDIAAYRPHAERLHGGLELHTFADPALLCCNGDLEHIVAHYEAALAGFPGILGFHGAFYDMISASVDPDVVALTLRRYRQGVDIAGRLHGDYIIFHANYMGGWKLANYRAGWHERQVNFWRPFVEEAAARGLTVLLENMWAPEPEILYDVLAAVNHPAMRACLDMAHAALYSQEPLSHWIEVLAPYLHVCHLNNTDGVLDNHLPLGAGIIGYGPILNQLRALPQPPLLTLEMPSWEIVSSSLPFFDLPQPA